MTQSLEFPALLRLIDERSAAFRAAVAAAPSLDVQVPTCPEWTLFDLVRHIGERRPFWAATVAAGPAAAPPADFTPQGPPAGREEREALVAWLAGATQQLLDALSESGPDRGCWTWWGASQSPQTSGAVARHQLQEISMHTYDAQLTIGAPEPLPTDVALDGVEDFLSTCCTTTEPWPHKALTVDYHASEGRSWRLMIEPDGTRFTRLPAGTTAQDAADTADTAVHGTASELVLFLYGRIPADSVRIDGDVARLLDLLHD